MVLDGIDQQINASPDRYPSRIFLLQKNPINNSTFIFTHTYVGMGFVNKSTLVPFDTPPRFFCFRKTRSTIQRSFSHTHMWRYRSEWALSTNQRWSRTTPLPDFLASEKPDQQFNAHFHTHICGGIGLDHLS